VFAIVGGTTRLTRLVTCSGILAALVVACLCGTTSAAEWRRYYPLDQSSPPGLYGEWSGYQQPGPPCHLQPVQIILPGSGTVSFYSRASSKPLVRKSPAQAAVALGNTYRLQLRDLEGYPGIELWPTIELVDMLHPPRGQEDEFPIPVTITEEEIELALSGRLVTKVIYLEPAAETNPLLLDRKHPTISVPPNRNVIEQADLRGRPMLILRLGSRTPVANENPAFFGNGSPLSPTAVPETK
jgi:hypothetical protein